MLLELADLLKGYVSAFHLFQYLTFRTIMSTLTALIKGSRSSAMDRVVSALLDDGNGGERHAA